MYALPESPPVVLEALKHRGVVACASAARAYGLWTLDDGSLEPHHVWIDPHRHATKDARVATDELVPRDEYACGCTVHRDRVVDQPGLVVVGIVHCLAQLAVCLGGEALFAALESALHQKRISAPQRAVLRSAVPRTMAWLVDFAESTSESGLESLLRLRLSKWGIDLAAQVSIPGVGTVDFVIGECLILEADGKENHEGSQRHKDLRRDALAAAMGYATLRFDSALILHEWPLVEAAILGALDRRAERLPA